MRVYQQGQADGLCGLYALMHFLNKTEWAEKPNKALWYLLDACRHFGWLTPQHLTEGFEDHHLKAILDLQIANYRLSFATYFLDELSGFAGSESYRALIETIVSRRGAVVTQNQNGGHWVLVIREKGEAVVLDSGNYENPRTPLSDRRLSEDGVGVAVLPFDRPKLEVSL